MQKNKNNHKSKFIFVVGGVMSGVGKGITTASIGVLLKSKGYSVTAIKADPYLNVDAGTMNPLEHGEVFVLDSGLETDQDMGNYERFLNTSLGHENYMTNGMIFQYVINKERALGYKGKCVEPTYHITEEILRRILLVEKNYKADFILFEIGGTVGEYQNAIFIEAARQLKQQRKKDVMFVMVSYIPSPSILGEMKTKPTQNAVRQLNGFGVNPDLIVGRANNPVDEKIKQKISDACGIDSEFVISAPNVSSIYSVPSNFEKEKVAEHILKFFAMKTYKKVNFVWKNFEKLQQKKLKKKKKIAIVGKYFTRSNKEQLSDVYISIIHALKVSSLWEGVELDLDWISSVDIENEKVPIDILLNYDGIIVPGGFGATGVEGKLRTIQYARENDIPFFGICYGMQLMIVEYSRNVLGIHDAHTIEVNKKTKHPVIHIMESQKNNISSGAMGGTMRLGAYGCIIKKGSKAYAIYKKTHIQERHRHRYEVNIQYKDSLEKAGLEFSGISPDGTLMEIAEVKNHPFMIGVQFHPEFLARPLDPHPLFTGFIKAL